ncbi:hypothetical protein MLD38_011712 [Melastoma candidum]|uniref:Uncharacterized protein n=1 Tax=Melastoma candidum TaxID=119954 RepID=A0ACB9R3X3_9MYRT|nr:hypothetical protein MLD38_011712 [Melastoma candidum]
MQSHFYLPGRFQFLCITSPSCNRSFCFCSINIQVSESWSYPPLNDTAEAVARVRETLEKRGWRLRT